MNYLNDGLRGISLIVRLNGDRVMVVAALCIALMAAAYVSHP
jgi:hypothetical protein